MHIRNGQYPYIGWKLDFPNVSFPIPRTGLDFPEHDIHSVLATPRPEAGIDYDANTHTAVEGHPEQIDSEWHQTWQIVELPPPAQCTRRQGRLALLQAGKLAMVESTISSIADTTERLSAQVEYEADTWEIVNPFLQSMWAQLGGTEAELNELFRLAVTL